MKLCSFCCPCRKLLLFYNEEVESYMRWSNMIFKSKKMLVIHDTGHMVNILCCIALVVDDEFFDWLLIGLCLYKDVTIHKFTMFIIYIPCVKFCI